MVKPCCWRHNTLWFQHTEKVITGMTVFYSNQPPSDWIWGLLPQKKFMPNIVNMLFCWIGILSNCLLNIYIYTHRLMLLSALEKLPFCNRKQSMQIPTTVRSAENKWLFVAWSSVIETSISTPFLRSITEEGWKECKSQKMGRSAVKCWFLDVACLLYLGTHRSYGHLCNICTRTAWMRVSSHETPT